MELDPYQHYMASWPGVNGHGRFKGMRTRSQYIDTVHNMYILFLCTQTHYVSGNQEYTI